METNPTAEDLDLSGERDVEIDEKNRISIPADFRKEILRYHEEPKLMCQISRGRIAKVYPESYYRRMTAKRRKSLTPGDDEEAFNRAFHGMTFKLEWDSQGRVVLEEKLRTRARLGKSLTLVGAGDHFELWNRDAWEVESERLLEIMHEIIDRERNAAIEKQEPQS